jgi:2-dehydropantoate 2-reductase
VKIAIMGTGGVGGYYGGLLVRSGQDVTFIARGLHLQALREKGLQVRSVHGNFTVSPARATDNPAEIGPVELVIVATKTYHIDEAAQMIKPMIGPDTVVLSLQNGVDAAERIGAIVGVEHLLGSATWLSAAIEAPGVIGQYSQFRRIVVGEFNGQISSRARRAYDVLNSTGATVELVKNIAEILWSKFIFIASVSALGSLTRVTFGEFRAVPEAREILIEATNEVASIARAQGVTLAPDIIAKTMEFIDNSAPNIKPSMQRDVESGRISELEAMVGIVVRLGIDLNVPTPVMRFAYAMLKPADLKAQGSRIS